MLPGLHCVHSAQVLGSFVLLVVTASQASAASAAASGHAPAASSAEQKANLQSTGLTRPVAVSHVSKGLGAPIHAGRGIAHEDATRAEPRRRSSTTGAQLSMGMLSLLKLNSFECLPSGCSPLAANFRCTLKECPRKAVSTASWAPWTQTSSRTCLSPPSWWSTATCPRKAVSTASWAPWTEASSSTCSSLTLQVVHGNVLLIIQRTRNCRGPARRM